MGNDSLVKLFANRKASVLFAFGPDECNSVLCELGAGEVNRFSSACSGTQADFDDQSEQGTLALAVV